MAQTIWNLQCSTKFRCARRELGGVQKINSLMRRAAKKESHKEREVKRPRVNRLNDIIVVIYYYYYVICNYYFFLLQNDSNMY